MRGWVAIAALVLLGSLLLGPAGLDWGVILRLRLPRALGALAAGGGVALAGLCMQAHTRNPLADPFILGMSGGAACGAVLSIAVSPGLTVLPAAAVGALGAAALAVGLAGGPDAPAGRLLLVGVAVSATTGALVNLGLLLMPADRALRAALYWTSGGLSGASVGGALGVALLTTGALIWLRGRAAALDALALGAELAASLGVEVRALRRGLLGWATLLVTVTVALAGPLAFIGLLAPHAGRLVRGAPHRALAPITLLFGAAGLLLADTLARVALAPRELPGSALTAALGAPAFLWLLRRTPLPTELG